MKPQTTCIWGSCSASCSARCTTSMTTPLTGPCSSRKPPPPLRLSRAPHPSPPLPRGPRSSSEGPAAEGAAAAGGGGGVAHEVCRVCLLSIIFKICSAYFSYFGIMYGGTALFQVAHLTLFLLCRCILWIWYTCFPTHSIVSTCDWVVATSWFISGMACLHLFEQLPNNTAFFPSYSQLFLMSSAHTFLCDPALFHKLFFL